MGRFSLHGGVMPTPLPPRLILPWRTLARAAWLFVRLETLSAQLRWVPASHERTCRATCRLLSCSKEFHGLMGLPEPKDIAAMRAVFERPFSDGSTLCERYGPKP